MKFITHKLTLATAEPIQTIDISDHVTAFLSESKIHHGSVTLITQHTTSAVVINESCPELQKDLKQFLVRLAEPGLNYAHNKVASDNRDNAHSHLLAHLMPSSQTIPIADGKLTLGDWQRLFFIELDGPRNERQVIVHISGVLS